MGLQLQEKLRTRHHQLPDVLALRGKLEQGLQASQPQRQDVLIPSSSQRERELQSDHPVAQI
jgi:hypothetical protein